MGTAHIRRLLGFLEYPRAQNFSIQDTLEFRRVVFSLEDKFVRSCQDAPTVSDEH